MPDSPHSLKLLLPPVSPAAPGALYEQVIAGLERAISDGRLGAGELLPSYRQLAEDLMVSVITVKRAYAELERQGVIFRRQGVGSFVAEGGVDRSRLAKLERAKTLLREACEEAAQAGLSHDEIRRLFLETLDQSL